MYWKVVILFLWGCFGAVRAGDKTPRIRIVVTLESPSGAAAVEVSPLAYHKSFAFSFTLDDGLVSGYLVAFPFFEGGKISPAYADQWGTDQGGDGESYPGLYYTDGCGNPVPFKAGLAVNAKNIEGADTVPGHGFLTWGQIKELYGKGWDVLNHGYAHVTGGGISVRSEIKKNNEAVERQAGIVMKDFVIPGGHDDVLSNGPYTAAAFDLGMETVQCEDFGNYRLPVTPRMGLEDLKLGRLFMYTGGGALRLRSGPDGQFGKEYPGGAGSVGGDEVVLFKTVDHRLKNDEHFWINAFTHSVGNQNLWNISLILPQFTGFFNRLASRYGEKGADNIWMAPPQEVYEYLLNKAQAEYTVVRKKNKLVISIDKHSLPSGLRYHSLTFLVHGDNRIRHLKCRSCRADSYSNHKNLSIINVSW